MIFYLKAYVSSYRLLKVQIHGLAKIYKSDLKSLPGQPTPLVKDHRKSKNNDFPIFGDKWVDKLENSSSVYKLCCISDLVRFMLKEGKGLVHEYFLKVYVDLKLMKSKTMISRM